jgi:HPt (histidine-containing phosphotransfer) domain-containing protein
MEPSTTLKGQLFDLKQRFVQTMPGRITAIATTLAGRFDAEPGVMERLERQFHTLAGTAGTYGLNAVAATAFEGEEVCAELKESSLEGENYTYLAFLVNQLSGALAADAPEQWTARTVLEAAGKSESALNKRGAGGA